MLAAREIPHLEYFCLQDEKEKDKEKEKEKEKADERVCKLRFVDKSFGARQKKHLKNYFLGKFSRPILLRWK